MERTMWRQSSYSGANNNCVEVALNSYLVAIRDSKDPSGGHLAVSPASWESFTASLKANQIQ